MSLIDNTRPAYRILSPNGFFGPDDHLYLEGEEIYFEGEPNEEMEPLNEAAQEKITALLARLDELGRQAAEKAGKAYAARPRTLDGALVLASAVQRADMNLMGATRREDAVTRVEAEAIPETGSHNAKRGRGRPKKVA